MEINIDLENLAKGNNPMLKYSEQFQKAIDDGLLEFLEKFEAKIYLNAAAYDIPKSVIGKIDFIPIKDGYLVTINGTTAMYFEYGTGIRGLGSPHPKAASAGWIYDVNQHGESGWWYPTVASDPNPYKWTDSSGQLRAWTKGKISKPYLYKSWLWGTRSFTQIIRKHIRRIKV